MRGIIYIFVLMLFTSFTIQTNQYEGIYEYKSDNFYERIELDKNFKFNYDYRLNSITDSLKGDYRIKGESLILDSNPQRDKVIVKERKKGNEKNVRFCVKNKFGESFNYTLYAINKDGDTITLLNQWRKSKLKDEKIESFYIVDSKGLRTPLYEINSTRTNYYEIQMEAIRVLDNEVWNLSRNSIIPRGMNGETQSYKLDKVKKN